MGAPWWLKRTASQLRSEAAPARLHHQPKLTISPNPLRKRYELGILLVSSKPLSEAAVNESNTAETNDGAQDHALIQAMLSQWETAAESKQSSNMRRFYIDDVIVFDIVPPLSYQGADLHCANWQAWFDKMKGPISFELLNSIIVTNGNLGTVFCITKTKIGDTEDFVRTTLLLTKIDGTWLIAHVHSSVPLPVEQLNLEPD
jgi:ketosteroid isomerase-like protein